MGKRTFQFTITSLAADLALPLNFGNAVDAYSPVGESMGLLGQGRALDIHLNTVDNGGTTPTSDVTLQAAWDLNDDWDAIATFTQVTTTDTDEIENVTTRYPPYLRLNIDVGGTPDYTYIVTITEYDE